MATLAGARPLQNDHRFFMLSSLAMALLVFAAFSLHWVMGRSTFGAPLLVHVHAIVFMAWVVLYVLQNALVAGGRIGLHKRLGWLGAAWIPLMVVLGIWVTVEMARLGRTPFFFTPAYFVVMNPVSVLTFAGLSLAAIVLRRQTAWHRRLHFCGMAFLIGPAVGRIIPLPLLQPHAGPAVFAVLILLPFVGVLRDLKRHGRVHPAWWWGIGTMVLAQAAIELVGNGALGASIYDSMVAGSPGAAVPGMAFPPPPGPPPLP